MQINKIMKALSHPVRRDIIARLKQKALSAGELAKKYDVSKPTMSAHFTALKDAGLVYAERDGVKITYHVNVTVVEEALTMLMSLLGAGNELSENSSDLQPVKTGDGL